MVAYTGTATAASAVWSTLVYDPLPHNALHCPAQR